ncbi:hypothetical protein H5410_055770 [Solanum commersonii]|uniref:Uncharacterized protein n=1 Tax=Solanum commersonii TaxID=4109 RepID=A0A9J5WKC0_SOLCO|nr:hypothetical protein H5410_055770 [Solanum commersonii]
MEVWWCQIQLTLSGQHYWLGEKTSLVILIDVNRLTHRRQKVTTSLMKSCEELTKKEGYKFIIFGGTKSSNPFRLTLLVVGKNILGVPHRRLSPDMFIIYFMAVLLTQSDLDFFFVVANSQEAKGCNLTDEIMRGTNQIRIIQIYCCLGMNVLWCQIQCDMFIIYFVVMLLTQSDFELFFLVVANLHEAKGCNLTDEIMRATNQKRRIQIYCCLGMDVRCCQIQLTLSGQHCWLWEKTSLLSLTDVDRCDMFIIYSVAVLLTQSDFEFFFWLWLTHRRQNVATSLLKPCEELTKKEGYKFTVLLQVLKGNWPARSLFIKMGYYLLRDKEETILFMKEISLL